LAGRGTHPSPLAALAGRGIHPSPLAALAGRGGVASPRSRCERGGDGADVVISLREMIQQVSRYCAWVLLLCGRALALVHSSAGRGRRHSSPVHPPPRAPPHSLRSRGGGLIPPHSLRSRGGGLIPPHSLRSRGGGFILPHSLRSLRGRF